MFNTPAAPVVKPGGYVVLKARMGLICAVSSCPYDLVGPGWAINAPDGPTEIVVDASGVMNGELDLSYLPDDPTELMMASLEEPLDRVARKMAYSGNQTYIPVLLEYLRSRPKKKASST